MLCTSFNTHIQYINSITCFKILSLLKSWEIHFWYQQTGRKYLYVQLYIHFYYHFPSSELVIRVCFFICSYFCLYFVLWCLNSYFNFFSESASWTSYCCIYSYIILTGGFWDFFLCSAFNSASSSPLRFHCAGGCWERTQDCSDFSISSQKL